MNTQTIKIGRLQAWRLKTGLKLINIGVALAGKRNEQLMRQVMIKIKNKEER